MNLFVSNFEFTLVPLRVTPMKEDKAFLSTLPMCKMVREYSREGQEGIYPLTPFP